jgi:hypothetical protein
MFMLSVKLVIGNWPLLPITNKTNLVYIFHPQSKIQNPNACPTDSPKI